MAHIKKILIIIFSLFALSLTAQVSFIGFDHPTCVSAMTNTYTYSNYSFGSHGYGYNIYRNGVAIYGENNGGLGPTGCSDLRFINDSVGFMVKSSLSIGVPGLFKTEDYGNTWVSMGVASPNYFGFYIINQNFAYYLDLYQGSFLVRRCSDLAPPVNIIQDNNLNSDIYKMDTTFNHALCNVDSLRILLKNGTDTITYHINEHFGIQGLSIAPSASLCPGHSASIPFIVGANFNSGNIFTAELSDNSGSFANAVSIGSLVSASAGTISATIPLSTPNGNGYKIRITSSDPVYSSLDISPVSVSNNLPIISLSGNINGINGSSQTLSGAGTYTICSGQSASVYASGATTYTWSNGVNSSYISVIPTITTTYSVTGENACGISSDSLTISIHNTPIVAVSGASFCMGANSVTLTATGALTYTWTSSGTSFPVYSPTLVINSNIDSFTNYLVTGSDGYCKSSVFNYLVANAIPNISFLGADPICIGSTANINAYGAQTYTWQNGATTSSIAVTPSVSTTYSLVGENECGISNASVLVDVSSNSPGVFISGNDSICIGSGTTLSGWCPGAITYTWSNGSVLPTIDISPTLTTTYTLFAENACGISSSSYLVDVDSTCQFVWPGDANSDGLVNNIDVLELGLHYSQVGPSRAIQSNQWQAFRANNWSDTITNGKNLNHSDCSGDGVISADDTLAIYNNYSFTHAFKASSTNNAPSFSIIPHELSVYKGQWGSSSIILADSLNPVDSLNGIAFTILFDSSLLESDSIYITYKDGFFGLVNQNLNFRKLNFPQYRIYAATSHTNKSNVSGYGEIATIHYKIDPLLHSNQHFWLQIINGFKMDNLGQVSSLTGCYMQGGYVDATIISIEEKIQKKCSVMPNPTNGFVTVSTNDLLKEIEISSIESQTLLKNKCNGTSTQIDLTGYNAGVYFLKISLVGGDSFIRKIILTK